ncbi:MULTISPECIES: helix-turn-helix transcriptional regulator [unclassified Herbaspirillum]|uniref:helix-turn-helix transcriptional regulator n=1 Tax=unclassified Herbaspirillum TaxID=2624150 RepID=UPI000E2FA6C4|nr:MULTISPECIES: helix-turn-helix transcriptional regulator [unclassified Herbaspirillum]RFB68762.1 helix-turn-helix transcriptional regulator [Herbaspirillum sp. 3R-3a1]TFI05669.1 helix-turn-helix transcriptional regulator [Herbaspirillum sp. 3R11]TFI13420.1 helix-turn-helix transcriptional regulator [Herbaspirillum sp. 3R-11]TFI21233.1 helix-turn-helix transcriptional regulator [Herbaspirillum sp. 3C11]
MSTGNAEQRFGQLVELIYDSVQDLSRIAPAMEMICREVGAIAGHYVHMDVESREVIASCVSNSDYQAGDLEYKEYYSQVDDRLGWLATGQVGEWRADHQRFDERFVRKSEIYNDFLFKYGGRHMVVGRIGERTTQSEAIAFLRPLGAEEYAETEYAFLRSLSPHLIRSATLRARMQTLERQQSASESVVAHLPYGTLWINAAGRIVSLNPQATAILAAGDGLSVRNDKLAVSEPADAERLQYALRMATAMEPRQGQWFAIARRKQSTPLLVSVIPATIPAALDPLCGGPFALLILQDMARQRVSRSAQLQVIYRLTPAETRLAEALLENDTIESYALKNDISRNTVRTHLASLFAKTGAKRQAELIRTLLASQPHVML